LIPRLSRVAIIWDEVKRLICDPIPANHSCGNTHFFEWDEATHAAYFKRLPDAIEVTIPKLPEMAAEQVDLASVPFVTFIANKKKSGDTASYSFVLRGYVRHWLDTVWAEYERVGLTDIVGAKESPRPPIAWPRPVMMVAETT
jgi:hypothetical protein